MGFGGYIVFYLQLIWLGLYFRKIILVVGIEKALEEDDFGGR